MLKIKCIIERITIDNLTSFYTGNKIELVLYNISISFALEISHTILIERFEDICNCELDLLI